MAEAPPKTFFLVETLTGGQRELASAQWANRDKNSTAIRNGHLDFASDRFSCVSLAQEGPAFSRAGALNGLFQSPELVAVIRHKARHRPDLMDKIERMDLSGLLARHLPLSVRIRPLLCEYPPIPGDTPSINVYSDYLTAAEQGKLPRK